VLLGRERECALLDGLIGRVESGASAVLVVTGAAGIGKTSLLEYAASRAAGFRILRARGAESEQDLPFAGLADLLTPVLGLMDRLPDRQREALAGALAVGPAVPADRFAVCAAALGLLAATATTQPVLALVDDAHWLDAGSAQAVEFAGRRLRADSVGLVVVVRDGGGGWFDSSRFDSLPVAGLSRAAARALLDRSGRPVTPAVADQLAAGAGGNPLALVEIPVTLSDAQLNGLEPLPEPLPLTPGLQRAFARRLHDVGDSVRRLLVLASADTAADLPDLQRAAALQSLDLSGLLKAEEAGLVRVGGSRVEFAHPLLRSAAYHSAGPAERRAAHQALADACDPGRYPIRRSWHLAAAAVGPDESVAETLDLAAGAAQIRNAYAVAARASQRAAELTADPARRAARLMAAGQAAHLGGDRASAAELLTLAADLGTDPRVRADAQIMRGYAAYWTTPPAAHYPQLVAAAEAVLPVDSQRAASLLSIAAGVCVMSGRLREALGIATRAADLTPHSDQAGWLESHAWLGYTSILTGSRATGLPLITSILSHPAMAADHPGIFVMRSVCSQCLMWGEDYQRAAEVLRTNIDKARALGRVADLLYALAVLSDLSFHTGDWEVASASAAEGAELSADYATAGDTGFGLACAARVDAATGAAAQCRAHLNDALRIMTTGADPILTYTTSALGLLELGLDNYERAAAELARTEREVTRNGLADPNVVRWRPDYIESLARTGKLATAREQLSVLEAEGAATGSRWAEAVAARSRGLLEDTPRDAAAHLEHAVGRAEDGATGPFDLARALLYLGEALRRAGKRRDARRPLAQAHAAFDQLGAAPWAKRAAAELAATGMTAARRRPPVHVRLTPQELRVALQVAEGYSNQEVAARLFLSPKTIEVHLSHIYAKLGVRSRTALAKQISSGAVGELQR
jgi:DNA-binding CsgD family transcriptional regulator